MRPHFIVLPDWILPDGSSGELVHKPSPQISGPAGATAASPAMTAAAKLDVCRQCPGTNAGGQAGNAIAGDADKGRAAERARAPVGGGDEGTRSRSDAREIFQALRAGAECLPAFTNSIRPLD